MDNLLPYNKYWPRLALLHLRYGIHCGQFHLHGPGACGKDEVGSPSHGGEGLVEDRANYRRGVLSWKGPEDLDDLAAAVARIEWEKAYRNDPESAVRCPPPGQVWTVKYCVLRDGAKKPRRYTFVPCARAGCGGLVTVDLDDPDYVIPEDAEWRLGWPSSDPPRGELVPQPVWYSGLSRCCEATLTRTHAPQPCRIVHGPVVAELERSKDARWTIWEATQIIFYSATRGYGLLLYSDAAVTFVDADAAADAIQWFGADLKAIYDLSNANLPADRGVRCYLITDTLSAAL